MSGPFGEVDRLCINTMRALSVDAIQKANSGHPGLPMGAAPMAYVLWQRHLKHDPSQPGWRDRDRFVLSAGHGSMMLYSLLHLTGYDLRLDEIKQFRQLGSRTAGHPEFHLLPGVEATTGPLGQGCVNAVGMAMAERALAHLFNRPGFDVVDHFTYALVGDGDLMEGIAAEAASLAGHLRLGKLIWLYDSNRISLDGPTSMAFTEDVGKRHEAYGWQVLRVEDGDRDLDAIDWALSAARADLTRPSLIIVNTTIGFGAPNKQGKSAAHGSPLGPDELALAKQSWGWPWKAPFHVPEEAVSHFRQAAREGRGKHEAWTAGFAAYAKRHPDLAEAWELAWKGELPAGWEAALPRFAPGEKLATRAAGGKALNAIAAKIPWLLGGDADLSSSTQTALKDGGSFEGAGGSGRNIHYGVREHAMAAIAAGIAYHGAVRNYTATFFAFADYMRPAIRLAAMNRLPVVFVFTHDSLAVGEDGPTHQPVEQLMSLRCIPNLVVLRPADPNETVEAWRFAMEYAGGPCALVLTRQALPTLDPALAAPPVGLRRGAYVLRESAAGQPRAAILGTGSEVHLALGAQAILDGEGIPTRVVSMPSWELFARQDEAYREQVLPASLAARVSVEAGVTLGWERWTLAGGAAVGIDSFGASAPEAQVMAHFGMTAENVAAAVRRVLGACCE